MAKILIVTNDFPPRAGGIQSFVHALAPGCPRTAWSCTRRLGGRGRVRPAAAVPGAAPPHLADAAGALGAPPRGPRPDRARLRHGCCSARPRRSACWPPRSARPGPGGSSRSPTATRRAGRRCPVARTLLRRIGDSVDVVTYLGEYFRVRLARALSPAAAARMARLAPGVDTAEFHPGAGGAAIRAQLGLAGRPGGGLRLPAGAPQGPGHPAARLARGPGPGRRPGPAAGRQRPGRRPAAPAGQRARGGRLGAVHRAGARGELPAYYDAGDVFAMPCRTRRRGLDVEGLGIVYLEASATGLPVIAGDSGGAPDAVLSGETGYVVPGPRRGRRWPTGSAELLADPAGRPGHGGEGPGLGGPRVALGPGGAAAGADPGRLTRAPPGCRPAVSCRARRCRRRSPWLPRPGAP